jgi:hypothetical protein
MRSSAKGRSPPSPGSEDESRKFAKRRSYDYSDDEGVKGRKWEDTKLSSVDLEASIPKRGERVVHPTDSTVLVVRNDLQMLNELSEKAVTFFKSEIEGQIALSTGGNQGTRNARISDRVKKLIDSIVMDR